MTILEKKVDTDGVTLRIEVPVVDAQPYLDKAATNLASKQKLPGFRPGHAPVAMVAKTLGAMAVYEEALNTIVAVMLSRVLKDEKIASVGAPEVSVEQLTPENPIIFKAVVTVMPELTLKPWKDVTIVDEKVVVADSEITKVIDDIRAMQAKEKLVLRPAKAGDKVELNFEVRVNGAIIEGGKGVKFPLILGSKSMIPGFEDQMLGLTTGQKKEFTLNFPAPYYNEQLSGKPAQFSVEVVSVFERELPELNDAWAQMMMGKDVASLKEDLKQNLVTEKDRERAKDREQKVIEAILERATIGAIPKKLVESEIHRMIAELQDDISRRGMEWDKYLGSIRKSEADLHTDLIPFGEKRVKSALLLRHLAQELQIVVSGDEIDAEIASHKESYKDNPEALAQISDNRYREYIASILQNRKTIAKIFQELKLV